MTPEELANTHETAQELRRVEEASRLVAECYFSLDTEIGSDHDLAG